MIATTTMRILCVPLMILFKSSLSVISCLKSMNPWQHAVPIHKVKLCNHVKINLKNRIIVVVRYLKNLKVWKNKKTPIGCEHR